MAPNDNLLCACRDGDKGRVSEIIASSSDELPQVDLNEALTKAAYFNHPDIMGLLLSHGAQITENAIHGACSTENAATLQHLLNHGLDVNTKLARGSPILRLVVMDEACTRLLLEHGANPNIPGFRGATPLSTAAADCPLTVMELLLSYGAEWGECKDILMSTIMRDEDSVAATAFVLEHGIDANTRTRRGPPLHCAVMVEKKDIVQCLLEHGADRSATLFDQTAAELAEQKGLTDIVKLLSE